MEQLGQSAATLFILGLLLVSGAIACLFLLGWWLTHRHGNRSPYSDALMARGTDLPYRSVEKVQDFLLASSSPENPPFDVGNAAICRETGRIFPDSINAFGVIRVNKRTLPVIKWTKVPGTDLSVMITQKK